MSQLSGRQRRFLRAMGNGLESTVYIGRDGVTPAVLGALEEALSSNELVKVRVERTCPLGRKEVGPRLAADAAAYLVQILGQTVLLYRPDPEEPGIQLPD